MERVKAITDARGVDVAYDSVGKDTFFGSLQCLAYCGHLVNFGQSSGPPEPVAMSQLLVRSSTISRPSVFHYAAQRSVLDKMATAVFTAIVNGWLQPEEAIKFPLESAHEAHALLQSRTAVCPIVLAA